MNPWLSLVTITAVIFLVATGLNVARVRRKTGIFAPAMGGDAQLERALRVQGNSLEWAVLFLPMLWIAGGYFDPRIAAAIGLIWIVGRILYMRGYMEEPAKREAGFLVQAAATGALLVEALAGVVLQLMHATS